MQPLLDFPSLQNLRHAFVGHVTWSPLMSDPIGRNVKGKQRVWPMKHKNTNNQWNHLILLTIFFGIVCYLYMREQLGMWNVVNLDIWSQYSGQQVCYAQWGIAIVKYNLDPKNINFTRSKTSRLRRCWLDVSLVAYLWF